jgi:hypothetical protein
MDINKNDAIQLGLATAVALNVLLTAGVAFSYYQGYQNGLDSGIKTGATLSEAESNSTPLSADVTKANTKLERPAEQENPIQTSVSLYTYKVNASNYILSVRVDEMAGAEKVIVIANNAECEPCETTDSSKSIALLGLRPGEPVSVIATQNDRVSHVRTHTVRKVR